MKSFFNSLLLLLSATFAFNACPNPFKDLEIRVDTNVFKYTALVEVKSSAGLSLDNATVTLKGADADKIYNTEGKKIFKISGGLLLLALDPQVTPSEGAPVKFSIDITADDYLPTNIPVTIGVEETSSFLTATMINTKQLPQGVNLKTEAVSLGSGGTINSPVTLSSSAGGGVTETVSVSLPAGTQFKDAAGNIIAASSLSVSTLVANTSSNDVLSLFPGGNLALPEIKTNGGSTTAGTLLPAALTEISMNAGSTPVKNFNQPIEILLQLDPGYHNPKTNAVIQPGDELDVFSYSAEQGIWTYESSGTVILSSGKPALRVSTTHLTWFTAASLITACTNDYNVKFDASWLANGTTHPVTFKAFSAADQKQLTQGTITVTNGTEASISNLPSTAVNISFYDIQGNVLATQNLLNPCSVSTLQTVSLNASPVSNNPKVTMQLYVRCPGNTQKVTLLPTFYLYYKETGAPASSYKLLGTVTKGYISTTLLNTSTVYDFKAVWGSYIKYAGAKTVSADNTATVGDGPNELIGTRAGATNLEMLKEVCSENGY